MSKTRGGLLLRLLGARVAVAGAAPLAQTLLQDSVALVRWEKEPWFSHTYHVGTCPRVTRRFATAVMSSGKTYPIICAISPITIGV
jgi:hypothetical protein